jgi:hypothetical protein
MKKSKTFPNERSTFPSQIRTLASKDAFEAMLLAERGKQFSAIEHNLHRYYVFLDEQNRMKSGKGSVLKLLENAPWLPKDFVQKQSVSSQKNFDHETAELCKFFLRCVEAQDKRKIIVVAG